MANSTLQQLPLSKKLNAHQQERRRNRIAGRATVAEALTRNNQNIGLALMITRAQVGRAFRWGLVAGAVFLLLHLLIIARVFLSLF